LNYIDFWNRLYNLFGQWREDHRKGPTPKNGGFKVPAISLYEAKIADIDPHLLYYQWTVRYDEKKKEAEGNGKKRDDSRDRGNWDEKWDLESAVKSIPAVEPTPAIGPTPAVELISKSKKFDPLLIRSIKPLERIGSGIWVCPKQPDRTKLWIHDDKPCVQVFSEEMAALTFILGITYFEHRKAKTGAESYEASNASSVGAFGTILTNRQVNHYNMMRLTHSRWGHQSHLGGGSGYSMIFAKHMACGCLPFAQSVTKYHSLNIVHTVVVTKTTLESLRKDAVILYEQLPNSTLEIPESVWKYLRSLPSMAIPDLYYPYSRTHQDSDISAFLDGTGKRETNIKEIDIESFAIYSKYDSDSHQSPKAKPEKLSRIVYTWPKAVAGIAFGGLVPMATTHLVDAVAFAVGEGHGHRRMPAKDLRSKGFQKSPIGKELKKFVDLILAVQAHANHRVGVNYVPIFGEEEKGISWMMTDLGEIDLDSYLFDKSRTTMDATWTLDQLTTVLEYLIALSDLNSDEERTKLADRKGPDLKMSKEEWKVHRAFEECANKVKGSLDSMLKKYGTKGKRPMTDGAKELLHTEGPRDTKLTEIEKILEDVIHKLEPKAEGHPSSEGKRQLSPKNCGDVAWCIIKAWTVLVKKISWHDDVKATDEYRPPKLEELPLVSAWE
jgi:hypothetical protein